MASKKDDISVDIPSDVSELASQIRAMPTDAPDGLEARAFEASVLALREGRATTGVIGRIGFVRWMAPVAAAAAVGLLAWAGAAWFGPSGSGSALPDRVATVALDEHVSDALRYADLFSGAASSDTLAEDALELDHAWRPTVESWSLGGEGIWSDEFEGLEPLGEMGAG